MKSLKSMNETSPDKLRNWINKSIQVIGSNTETNDIEELHQILIDCGIPEYESSEILIFLPTAFCRKLLSDLDWPENYIEYYSEEKQIPRKYSDNAIYRLIEEETTNYWENTPKSDEIRNILAWSSEMEAINQMLQDGGELENIKILESKVIR